jgi:hypothetical protein
MTGQPAAIPLFAIGWLLATCQIGAAQPVASTSRVEIAASFAMVTLTPEHAHPLFPSCSNPSRPAGPCSTPATFPLGGWALSVGYSVHGWLALTAEVAGYDNKEFPGGNLEVNHVRSFMAGPTFVFQLSETGRRFFGRLLVGRVRSNVLGGDFAIQPGGGLDVPARGPVALHLELDYCFVPRAGGNLSAMRGLLGIVARFGSR